ncbi:hypothetical protein PMZ80_009604 [Knufia obscura]|uniref:AB hydrolase-1 domain-containing protein n=2 Tax=Knufia TaxID=430999 RepID=A0AAN8I622_9EURO|nr:hypothetical protein PMZ80_009604 [Knufia obscura]KAK5951111.1 hypothetical protein OHC33_007864 [Knufia fluminis]
MTNITEHNVKYHDGDKQISYLASGPSTGPLLIFIHGWPAIAKTWESQLNLFGSLGFYAVAPDMPGYGNSTANKNIEDYAHDNIIPGLLALLEDTGRTEAVWLGHDWGSGVISSLVATHPEVCKAMVWMAVPYKTIELGLEEVLKYVNRDMYPEDKHPKGQWDYMSFYEESFDKATAWFDQNIAAFTKKLYSRGNPAILGKPAFLATVRRDGGWYGGVETLEDVPLANTCLDEATYNDLVTALQKTGFGPADAYYMNHDRNRAFNLEKQKNGGVLEMPCLFIQAKYDVVCDTVTSRLAEPMAKHCKNYSFTSIDAGHWVALEKPAEANAAIVQWLCRAVPDWWPGAWQNRITTYKK